MSTDDSGIYDVRKMRPDGRDKSRTGMNVTWGAVGLIAGGLVSYGVTSQRVTDTERRIDAVEVHLDRVDAEVNAHATKIEVDRAQYAEIIRRLDDLNAKIEHQQR